MARIKAEEGEKMRQPSLSQRTPAQSSRSKGKETMVAETASPVKAQPARGNAAPGQIRANKQYSFRDEHVVALFKLLQKSNKLKLPEPKQPEEVGKTDDPNYCLYHRMVGHPTKSFYIFKDVLQALIDTKVLKLRPEQKKVTANAATIQFGSGLPLMPAGVAPIPKGEMKIINFDPHH